MRQGNGILQEQVTQKMTVDLSFVHIIEANLNRTLTVAVKECRRGEKDTHILESASKPNNLSSRVGKSTIQFDYNVNGYSGQSTFWFHYTYEILRSRISTYFGLIGGYKV